MGIPAAPGPDASSEPKPVRVHEGVDSANDHGGARRNLTFSVIAMDVAAILIPLAFTGFVVGIFTLNGSRVDERAYARWQDGINIFASAFPILFAVIVGRLMYQIARWRLEQGTTIGFLEQMMGSRTFGGVIVTQFNLGAVNLFGIGLVLLWVFSPLGTQAILRALETRLEPTLSPTDIVFMETVLNTGLSNRRPESEKAQPLYEAFFGNVASSLGALLNVPQYIQTDTMDLWGNVKIPFLGEAYDNKTIHTPATDWQDVVWSQMQERYSALAGIPIGSIPVGNTTLSIESGYIELDCDNFVFPEDPMETLETIEWDWKEFAEEENAKPPLNASWQGVSPNSSVPWRLALDRFVDPLWTDTTWHEARRGLAAHQWQDDKILADAWDSPGLLANETGIEAGPTRLVFRAYNYDSGTVVQGTVIWGYCDVRQRYVESRVHCQRQAGMVRQNCTAVAQRPSRRRHAPETVSHLNFPELFEHISRNLPKATSMGGTASTNLALMYLNNPRDMSRNEYATDLFSGIPSDKAGFSRRLSQLLNTYILLSSFDFSIVTPDGAALSELPTATAQAEVSDLGVIYFVPRAWIALGLLSCLVLLLGGIASIVLTHISVSPEILGYVSTLVRDSKFFDLPPGTGHMPAMEISKTLKDQRVRYGYSDLTQQGRPLMGVGPEGEIGGLGKQAK